MPPPLLNQEITAINHIILESLYICSVYIYISAVNQKNKK